MTYELYVSLFPMLAVTSAAFLPLIFGLINRRDYFATTTVICIATTFISAAILHDPRETQVAYIVNAIVQAYFWWKYRKDDDDDERRKRRRLVDKVKSHIPKPTVVLIRPVEQER